VPDAVNTVILADLERDTLTQAVIAQCERLRDRFAVLDIPPHAGDLASNPVKYLPPRSQFAAVYYPHVRVYDPRSRTTELVPPSGFVAGVYALNDVTRGVHKAPANYELRGILSKDLSPTEGPLEYVITKGQHDILNPLGINVIRDFRSGGQGIKVWGARTLSSDPEWIYVNVRRLFNFVEESVDQGLQWTVFEPNSQPTWDRVRRTLEIFLERVWRDGALSGAKREEAFFVRCDRTTMSTDDILNGRLICLIGLAAVRPAEFVVLRFSQFTAESAS
jgi:phage tail sheath protein FI